MKIKRVLFVLLALMSISLVGCEAQDAQSSDETNNKETELSLDESEYITKAEAQVLIDEAVAKAIADIDKEELRGEKGDPGEDGVGIVSTTINEKGNLCIEYSDGTTADIGLVKGEKGEKGEKGDTGVSATVNNTSSWENGTLLINSTKSMPTDCGKFQVTNVTVEKNHCDFYWQNQYQNIEYIVKIEGKIKSEYLSDLDNLIIHLNYYNLSNPTGFSLRYYPIQKSMEQYVENIETVECTIENDGSFIMIYKQYNMYSDFDSYFIDTV